MKILVLGGGDSTERDVSLRSAKAVANASRKAGFSVIEADPIDGIASFDSNGKDLIVFPILHGKGGEDGGIQKELEIRGLAYLGADSRASANCFDKWLTRQILVQEGIKMPNAAKVSSETYKSNPLSKHPHALKVLRGGSSIGTLIVKDPSGIKQEQVDGLFSLDNEAVLEELIEGTEITVPILDKSALPVIEIVPPKDEEFDYENKYNGRTQEIVPAKNINKELQINAQALAEKVHSTMGARHLSRVDIMANNDKLYVLEINTMPGLTDQSLYPKSAASDGLDMPQLAAKFAQLVKRDYNL